MKKIIGIVFASLMFANIGFAEMRLIEEKTIKDGRWSQLIQTVCIDRYKFVTAEDFSYQGGKGKVGSISISITQIFEERDGKSLPAKC